MEKNTRNPLFEQQKIQSSIDDGSVSDTLWHCPLATFSDRWPIVLINCLINTKKIRKTKQWIMWQPTHSLRYSGIYCVCVCCTNLLHDNPIHNPIPTCPVLCGKSHEFTILSFVCLSLAANGHMDFKRGVRALKGVNSQGNISGN